MEIFCAYKVSGNNDPDIMNLLLDNYNGKAEWNDKQGIESKVKEILLGKNFICLNDEE